MFETLTPRDDAARALRMLRLAASPTRMTAHLASADGPTDGRTVREHRQTLLAVAAAYCRPRVGAAPVTALAAADRLDDYEGTGHADTCDAECGITLDGPECLIDPDMAA